MDSQSFPLHFESLMDSLTTRELNTGSLNDRSHTEIHEEHFYFLVRFTPDLILSVVLHNGRAHKQF